MNIHPTAAVQPVMTERKVSLISALIVLMGPMSLVLFTPAMPELGRAFGASESAAKMTLLSYFVGFAVTQLFCGPLSDGLGRRPVLLSFVGIYMLGSLGSLLAPNIDILIAARFVQGIGAAAGVAISRAIVRDLFVGQASARIMNTIGMIMGLAPALAPTLGGITLELFGWQAIFVIMLLLGVVVAVVVKLFLVETVTRDLSRIRPRALISSYATLLSHRYFLVSAGVIAGALGAFFTMTTILPFVLMDRVGLTPTQFGLGMLTHSLSFFLGTVVMGRALRSHGASRLVPVGLASIAVGCVLLAVLLRVAEPTFVTVMAPVAFYVFGAAFVMPAMTTASLAPFPHIAGAASALAGFLQIGGGLAGGVLAVLIGDPVLAMATVVPAMGASAIVCWLIWRRLPEPAVTRILPPEPPAPPAE